jgi:hypothetical protein
MNHPIKNPLIVDAKQGVRQQTNNIQTHHTVNFYGEKSFKKIFNRDALPSPIDYYRVYFSHLPTQTNREWINVACCFHDDKNPSLSLNLKSGGFYCFGCGAKGGDIVAFHMQHYGIPFVEAITFFGAWIYEK